MPKRALVVLLIAFSLLTLLVPGMSLAAPFGQAEPAPIRLKAAQFTPSLGEAPNIPPGLTIASYAAGQRGYYIVQFVGPVLQEWKDQIAAEGAEILDYIPDYAFKVRMNPAEAVRVEALGSVAWVGLFQPAYKLSPDLLRDGVHVYSVRLERGANFGLAVAAIQTSGAELLLRSGDRLMVAADSAQLDAIAHVLDVAWVENFVFKEKFSADASGNFNEYAGSIIGADIAHANGYDGSGQILAISDTGLGTGSGTPHPDIPSGRITAIYDWATVDSPGCYDAFPDGAQDVDSGHGTHTSLSAISDGDGSGRGKGTAPGANLVFQAIEDYIETEVFCASSPDGYYLTGLPADLHDLFQQAYDDGARIHSNSWGSDVNGDYTQDSADTDDFIWNNPLMTITFSAGNSGTDGNSNGIVDNDSIGSPATAKNLLTIGASENDRGDDYPCDTGLAYTACAAQSGLNVIATYFQSWPTDFPTNPLRNDPIAGNAEQMAAFSSRGNTDDGRIKPDVVAPGTWILSGYSDKYQQEYDGSPNPQPNPDTWQYDGWGFPLTDEYKYMGGTSMSNPLAAGAAAVVRDFYDTDYAHDASAALVKATLINSAHDLLDENNDGVNDNDYPIPNVHEGWGRIDLANATDDSHLFYDVSPGLNTSDSTVYEFYVSSSGTPFKVTLVWTDYPSTAGAGTNLVNNLNLVVTSPSATQ